MSQDSYQKSDRIKTKNAVLIVFLCVVAIITAGFFVLIRMPYFNVEETEITYSSEFDYTKREVERIAKNLEGTNIFTINLSLLEKDINSVQGVKSTQITRFYPNKLIFNVETQQLRCRLYSFDSDGSKSLYFVYDDKIEIADAKSWNLFPGICSVEISKVYVDFLMSYGFDIGFWQMVQLTRVLWDNNLISALKYDNINKDKFGRLNITMNDLNAVLAVREPVKPERLTETLEYIISDRTDSKSQSGRYDLYSKTLISGS